MSKVINEFSRFADQYNKYNMIQAEVAKVLVSKIPKSNYSNILDFGSGSGEVYKNIDSLGIEFSTFTAFDSSKNMLNIHPTSSKIKKICGDFNSHNFRGKLSKENYSLIISASALQWSTNLNFTLSELAKLSHELRATIFTSNTFKTLHQTANIASPIYSATYLKNAIKNSYANVEFELQTYKLYFDSVREMFKYIKKSGVSSGEKKLSFKEMKHLMSNYPLDYLEFEVLFVRASN